MSLFAEYAQGERGVPLEELHVRPAEERDAVAIAELSARREGIEVDRVLPVALRETRGEFPRSQHRLLVATTADEVIGFGRSKWLAWPADSPARAVPEGWYLSGVIVAPEWRRRGVGSALTRARLSELFLDAREVFYVASTLNRVSLELHARLGFVELTRDFELPGVSFQGGEGALLRLQRADYRRAAGS